MGGISASGLLPVEDHATFLVTNTIMQLLHVKVIFLGLDHDNLYEHIRNFVGHSICSNSSIFCKKHNPAVVVPFLFNSGSNQIAS